MALKCPEAVKITSVLADREKARRLHDCESNLSASPIGNSAWAVLATPPATAAVLALPLALLMLVLPWT